jgi:N-acetylglutamate synthase
MNLMEVELAARHAWPALEEQEHPFGVFRYAEGVHRRANSLYVFPAARFNSEELIAATEQFFRSKEQPAIVRILQPKNSFEHNFESLDKLLDSKGYELQAPSKLMTFDLCERVIPAQQEGRSLLCCCELAHWLLAWHAFTGRGAEEIVVNQSMLSKIKHPVIFMLVKNSENQAVSCGMAVLSERGLGLFGIATREKSRNQGYGGKLVAALINWGRSAGAEYAYLQVESANKPAIRLYRTMGFRDLYSYWYRVKMVSNRNGIE